MFKAGDRVYWVTHGLRQFGVIAEAPPPRSSKAQVRSDQDAPAEPILVRRLFRAPPDLEHAARILHRRPDHDTTPAEAAVDHVTREASFIASDGTVDRFGDILDPAGWDLTAFRRNPVFLWQHDVTQPIGTVPSIQVKDDRLLARARFADAGIMPLADQLFRLVEAGQLCAVSVGARALADPEPIRKDDDSGEITGFRYAAMELLELSLVSVPANPNALRIGRKLGVADDILLRAFEIDASVANREAYFDALRASVRGLKLTPRLAKPPNISPENRYATHIGSNRGSHPAARRESDCARRTTHQSGDGKPRTE